MECISSETASFLLIEVLRFPWIFAQIVQFGLRRVDEVVILLFHSTQLAPVEVQAWQESFGIEAAGVRWV